jgi:hypothetical protein
MGEVITYKNDEAHCYCQVKLDSGERVLVSLGNGGIKVMELDPPGLLPVATLWESSDARWIITTFLDPKREPVKHPLDAIRDRLLDCPSIAEFKRRFLFVGGR